MLSLSLCDHHEICGEGHFKFAQEDFAQQMREVLKGGDMYSH